jgi:Flp pilus assembly pilin Flp
LDGKTGSRNRTEGINAMSRTISRAKDFFRRNQGQAMPEYAVVLAVVSSGSAFLLAGLGARVGAALLQVAGYLP